MEKQIPVKAVCDKWIEEQRNHEVKPEGRKRGGREGREDVMAFNLSLLIWSTFSPPHYSRSVHPFKSVPHWLHNCSPSTPTQSWQNEFLSFKLLINKTYCFTLTLRVANLGNILIIEIDQRLGEKIASNTFLWWFSVGFSQTSAERRARVPKTSLETVQGPDWLETRHR